MSDNRCRLCGKEIAKAKGQSNTMHNWELQHGVHLACQQELHVIAKKHQIASDDYLNAIIDALFEQFPQLEETKSMQDFRARARKANEELENKFPFLKEKKEEAK